MPGVAASLVGLAHIAAARGLRDEALALAGEAGADLGVRARILYQSLGFRKRYETLGFHRDRHIS